MAVAVTVMTPGTAYAADKTLRLRNDTPMTAAGGNASCPGVPGDKDGWHFGVRNHPRVTLTSLTVTFKPGGQQTITSFADATNAYVASERGAKLTAAKAEVDGGLVTLLLVSYIEVEGTCPGQAPPPPPPPPPAPAPQPDNNGNGQPKPDPKPDGNGQHNGGNGQHNGGNGNSDDKKNNTGNGQKPKPKPGHAGNAAPSTTPTAPATPGATEPTTLPSVGVDQPEVDVNGENGTPVAAIGPDDAATAGGLGIAGFATIAMGAFLLLFGGVSGYVNWRRRRPR
ncbi:hypothetical protein GCM10027589_46790 [Actinocorallia lasiicapitis]